MISEAAVKEFQKSLRGEVLTPADGEFEAARRVFNAMVDKRPAFDRPLRELGRRREFCTVRPGS